MSEKLFRAEAPYGSDLAATDIQRSRDHGLAPYNAYRVACGFTRAHNFSDFEDLLSVDVRCATEAMYYINCRLLYFWVNLEYKFEHIA